MRPVAVILIAAALALLGARADFGGGDGSSSTGSARVVRVVDGDTIKVDVGGRPDTVRYIGIDTPESVKPGVPVQCFAKAASAANKRLVAGRTVRLVVGREPRDRYGRLLAYVYRGGVFVNERLLTDGYARTLAIAPNTRYASRFTVLQNIAKSERRGLWGRC